MSECKHKLGLLTLRDCGNEVEVICAKCGKPVCSEHFVVREEQRICLECVAGDPGSRRLWADESPDMIRERERAKYYNDYGYNPGYGFGHYHYGDNDYQDMEQPGEEEFEDFETDDIDLSDEDFQDS